MAKPPEGSQPGLIHFILTRIIICSVLTQSHDLGAQSFENIPKDSVGSEDVQRLGDPESDEASGLGFACVSSYERYVATADGRSGLLLKDLVTEKDAVLLHEEIERFRWVISQ